MNDKLKEFIKLHKNDFDIDFDENKSWQIIQSKIKRKNNWYLQFAASIIFLLCFSYTIYIYMYENRNDTQIENTENEFSQVESYYKKQIEEKKMLINNYEKSDHQLIIEFLDETNRLDSLYNELKISYKNIGNEQVINAMTLNLQLRIDILNEQLRILKKYENEKNKQNQNITI